MSFNQETTAFEQGPVVVNTQRDDVEIRNRMRLSAANGEYSQLFQPFGSAGSDHHDCFSIYIGEIVLGFKDSDNFGQTTDTDRVGVSSLNGAYVEYDGERTILDAQKARVKLRDQLTLLGIARNDAPFDVNDSSRDVPMFAALIGGTKSMYNTGEEQINPGDILCWDLPRIEEHMHGFRPVERATIDGVEDRKLLPVLCKFEDALNGDVNYITNQYMSNYYKKDRSGTDDDNLNSESIEIVSQLALNEFVKNVQGGKLDDRKMGESVLKLMSSIVQAYRQTSSRVIGKAITGALPGQQLDVLIGSNCV